MAQKLLSLENLKEVDGGTIAIAFDKELQAITKDLNDRPRLNKPRKLKLELTFIPKTRSDIGEDLDDVEVNFDVAASIPKIGIKSYRVTPKFGDQLAFHPDLPGNPNDETLMDEIDRKRGEAAA